MWFKKEIPSDLSKLDKCRLTAYIGSYSDAKLAGQYENAINILINQTVEGQFSIDAIAHPLLYLMRHSIELLLKENIKYLNNYSSIGIKDKDLQHHNLNDLFELFEKHYNQIANTLNFKEQLKEEYDKYSARLKDLITMLGQDVSSFRYTHSRKEDKIFDFTDKIDIVELKKGYDKSIDFLIHTADVISRYTNYSDYLKIDESIKENGLCYVHSCFYISDKDWLIEQLNETYKTIRQNEIWEDCEENHFLHLKEGNNKCYIIPMKK
ncbi:MAG: hypothetical protein LBR81_05760 [Prevotellaceae bacterium]|jgi:hypothetical protein|nr:hypothetical protein [Prevotellaceae bacterium]